MFSKENEFSAFLAKQWLSSSSVYKDSLLYMTEAYETNGMAIRMQQGCSVVRLNTVIKELRVLMYRKKHK